MKWRACGLNLVMISLLASNWQDFKLKSLQFHFIKQLKKVIPTLKTCYFEASEEIITKFKSQAPNIIKIKYWKVSGSGNPPFFIPALRKIAFLGLKTGLWQWYTGISVNICLDCLLASPFTLKCSANKGFSLYNVTHKKMTFGQFLRFYKS